MFLLLQTARFASRVFNVVGVVFLLLFCSANSLAAISPNVTVVLSENGGAYTEFSHELQKILSDKDITLVASENIPNAGLVIGVGMKAATAVSASNAPFVLNVLIPKAGYKELQRQFPTRANSRNFSAIFLDQPAHRQAALIANAFPDRHEVGLLYSSPPENIAQLRRELVNHDLHMHEQPVSTAYPLAVALQDVLENSELLLALPDALVYNNSTIRNILLSTYRHDVPLIGFSSGYVRAGAMCAVFSTPQQIATQTATVIRQFRNSHTLPTALYPREFTVMVNEHVAHSLNLQIKPASVFHDEIENREVNRP